MINPNITIDILNESSKNSMVEHLGIIYTDVSLESFSAKMPVDYRTHQPLGLLPHFPKSRQELLKRHHAAIPMADEFCNPPAS